MNRKMIKVVGVVLAAVLVAGCGQTVKILDPSPDVREKSPSAGNLQIANPNVSVDNAAAFSDKLGITLDVSEDCTEVSYTLIADRLAQIKFTYNDNAYCVRADLISEDETGANGNSGIYGDFIPANLLVRIDADEVQAGKIGEDTMLVLWEKGEVRYSLSSSGEIDFDRLLEALGKIRF